eukprot:jgi/Mesen1/9888/ME000070S09179
MRTRAGRRRRALRSSTTALESISSWPLAPASATRAAAAPPPPATQDQRGAPINLP